MSNQTSEQIVENWGDSDRKYEYVSGEDWDEELMNEPKIHLSPKSRIIEGWGDSKGNIEYISGENWEDELTEPPFSLSPKIKFEMTEPKEDWGNATKVEYAQGENWDDELTESSFSLSSKGLFDYKPERWNKWCVACMGRCGCTK